MKIFDKYVSPKTNKKLNFEENKNQSNNLPNGKLTLESEEEYKVINGIPYLLYPPKLPKEEVDIINWYNNNYEFYDEFLPLTFETFNENEDEIRSKIVDSLNIKPDFKILETGSGTGRDSILLASKLNEKGELHVTDIFDKILLKSIPKLEKYNTNIFHSVINAIHLPFPDNYFDVYYHFGGFNTFSDKKKAFEEINRVVKKGGKVIVGDESMPSWLRETEFGKILMNSNSHYKFDLPLEFLHPSSRDVKIEYIIGGVFYLISYTVSEGEPYGNFDFKIPGIRGGTHRTRYYGHLEGVDQKTIELAKLAREKENISMHDWLEKVIKEAALNVLSGGK